MTTARKRPTPKQASDALAALEAALGHRFKDRALLTQALTHSSASKGRVDDNERLEFLGDRVLSLAVAEIIYRRFPGEVEGELARRHAALVRRDALGEVARRIGLAAHIQRAGSDAKREADNTSALADACEAVIAALYLDGGLAAAESFVAREWEPLIAADYEPPRDAKTSLQEWAQGRGDPLPRYTVVARDGPDHQPLFTVTAALKDGQAATATGTNKRAAEQAAAAMLLRQVGVET